MFEFDWKKLIVTMFYPVPVKEVFRAFATCSGMEAFFISEMSVFGPDGPRDPESLFESGDRYRWRWLVGKELEGEIIEVGAPRSLTFTFGDAMVRIDLESYNKGTLLKLTQFDMPDSEKDRVLLHMNCRGGWIYHLTVLRGYLVHGIDIRDHNPATARSAAVDWQMGEHEKYRTAAAG